MNIVISSGHSLYVRGARGYIDEVDEARRVVERVAEYLKRLGCNVYKFHDNTSKTQSQNLKTIINYHNSKNRDIDISIHFNAGTKEVGGVEVLYYSEKELSAKVSKAISNTLGIRDRGAKHRPELDFLEFTKKPAILVEVCFVDTKTNTDAYTKNFDKMCLAIAESITGKKMIKKEENVINKEEVRKLNLQKWQKDELAEIYKLAYNMGIFSSDKHVNKVLNNELTIDEAVFLLTAMLGRHLKGGK